MKNIIIFFPSYERGGAEKILLNIIKHLPKKNFSVYLITNADKKKLGINGIKILKIPDYNIPLLNNRIVTGFIAIKYLICLLLKLNKIDTRILSMQSNFFSVLISKIFNFKVFVRVSEDPCGATYYADNRLLALLILISKFITYNFSNGIITNGNKSKLCVQSIVYNKKKVRLLFNPYLSRLRLIKNQKKEKNFLHIGRLCKQKNQKCLIEAFNYFKKNNKEFKLIIIGDGPDKSHLISQVNKLNLKKDIIFKGWENNLKKYYTKAYAFILPSLYEGMPNALIDAINFEIPCITSDASGTRELLLNGKGGIVINKIDEISLSKKMLYLTQNYKNSQKKILKSKKNLNKLLISIAIEKYINFITKF